MTVIGPSTGAYDPTRGEISYSDHSGVTVTVDRARFLRPLAFASHENCAPGSRVRFRSDAASLVLHMYYNNLQTVVGVYNDPIAIYVDGVFYSDFDPVDSRTAFAYDIALNFGTSLFRTIEIIFPYGAGLDFIGIQQDPLYRLEKALPRRLPRFMCIGDSITHGFWSSKTRASWPFLLAESKGYELINMGFGGAQVLDHLAGDDAGGINPNVITLLLGYNDFALQVAIATFKSHYTTLLSYLLNVTTAKIYVITPTWSSTVNTITLAQYRTAIIELVGALASSRITVIDGLNLATNSTAHFPDTVHPNDAGSASIAGALASIVAV